MAFDWHHYLEISKQLEASCKKNSGSKVEAWQRIAIGRAYYTVHHLAIDYAVTRGYPKRVGPAAGENHGKLIGWFKGQGTMTFSEIGELLGELRDKRNRCDYELIPMSNMNAETENAILNADEIIRSLV